MARYNFLVFTNAVEGREKGFNDWYTNQHLPDLLKIPGIVAAQRFSMAETQHMDGPHNFKYLAIYEIETDNVAVVLDEIRNRAGTDLMPLHDGLGEQVYTVVHKSISDRVSIGGKHARAS